MPIGIKGKVITKVRVTMPSTLIVRFKVRVRVRVPIRVTFRVLVTV